VRAAVGSLAEIGPALTGSGTDAETAWAAYLRRTLQPALDRIGVKPKDGEPLSAGLARPALLRLLALQGRDPAILELAASLSRDYRNDPASVPPSLVDLAIVVGALNGDRAQFDDYRRRFESTGIPIERTLYLAGLAAFRDPALRREALDYALEGPLRPQEVLAIPSAMGVDILSAESRSSGVAPDEVTAWVEQHHAGITERLPGNQTARMLSLFHGCSPDRQDRLQRFMAGPGKSMLGAEARAARLSDAMRECAALSEREGERTGKWLMSSSVKN
jgi:hypothetical protein